jgi:hypothetical protein
MNADLASLPTGRPAPDAMRARSDPAAPAARSTPGAGVRLRRPRLWCRRTERAEAPAPKARAAAQEASRKLAEKGSELTIEFEDALNRMVFRLVDTKLAKWSGRSRRKKCWPSPVRWQQTSPAGVLLRGDA